jgi:predicted enzyme related to lactoylglutathione lyase
MTAESITSNSPLPVCRRPTGGPLVVIYALDLESQERRVKQAGGTIVRAIFSFPGGRFHFTDPSGNELAVWSDKEKA